MGGHANWLFLELSGHTWPVEVTARGASDADPLLRAVVDLVRAGCASADQVLAELAPEVDGGLVETAIDVAVLRRFVTYGEGGALAPLLEPEDQAACRMKGCVFWEPLSGGLMPFLVLSERGHLSLTAVRSAAPRASAGRAAPRDREEAGKPVSEAAPSPEEAMVGANQAPSLPPPSRKDVGRALASLSCRQDRQVLSITRREVRFENDLLLEQLFLPEGARARRYPVYVPIELRTSPDGRPNLVVYRPSLRLEVPPVTSLWNEGLAVLQEHGAFAEQLREVERRWRCAQAESLLPHIDFGEFGSLEGLSAHHREHVTGLARLDVETSRLWGEADELLMGFALEALDHAFFWARARTGGGEAPAWPALRAWAAFVEALTASMLQEARSILEAPWRGEPRLRAEAEQRLQALGLDLGPTRQHVLSLFPGPNVRDTLADRVRRGLPTANAGRRGGSERLGAGENLALWALATLVEPCEPGLHTQRVRRALTDLPSLFEALDRLVAWRNVIVHNRHDGPVPHRDVVERLGLQAWRALRSSARPRTASPQESRL
jgi:hypothetical protein